MPSCGEQEGQRNGAALTREADGNLADRLTRRVGGPELPDVTVTAEAARELLEALLLPCPSRPTDGRGRPPRYG
ncbi:hypothetical protein GCM10009757_52060 [Streptomyces cheonanensis]|uniref:Uncharacterized protein n=1 Tax=Streptomyces cheonanensis TaxID=312720 RepID=A0ABP5H5S3_9ACTN